MSRSPGELLREALAHLESAVRYAERLDAAQPDAQMVADAVCMRLSAGIESLSRLDEAVGSRAFGDEWHFMRGMRNRIAHGYMLIDPAIITRTIEADVPGIISAIETELRNLEP